MAIDTNDVRDHVKEAIQATGSVQYPDLLLFVAQRLLRGPIDEVLARLEKKELIQIDKDHMGAIITRIKKKKD